MDKDQYESSMIYLNEQRLEVINSKEYFWGKKLIKYLKLIRHFKIGKIIREIGHDIYAFLYKKNNDHQIMDFSADAIRTFKKRVVVYTSIYGKYDNILNPLTIDENCEYYIFTDQDVPEGSIWVRVDDSQIPKECSTDAMKNRFVKMFPHKFFKCDYSIYIDGNLQIIGHPSLLVQKKLSSCPTGIAMHLSPRENCIYEEARTVCHVGKINKKEMKNVLGLYKKNKMPKHYGMFECNVIVRDHNNERCKRIMDEWWSNYRQGVKRDQLYFTLVLFMQGYNFNDVINFGASVNKNKLFLRKNHQ